MTPLQLVLVNPTTKLGSNRQALTKLAHRSSFAVLLGAILMVPDGNRTRAAEFAFGADLSFLKQAEGQRSFLDEVTRAVIDTPEGRGKGIFWWEPAVGNRGGLVSRSFFDESATSLPVLSAFDQYTRPMPWTNAH